MVGLQNVLAADQSGFGSPYAAAATDAPSRPHQSRTSFGLHLALFLVTFGWLVSELQDRKWNSGTHLALLVSCSWLLAGPHMVVRWYRLRAGLLAEIDRMGLLGAANVNELRQHTIRFKPLSLAVLIVPVGLMLVALAFGGDFTRVEIGINSTLATAVAAVVLSVGGLAAGYGVSCACRTIVLALALARMPGPFAPYAGVTSAVANTVAAFCFSAAMLFGGGGAVLLPAVIVCIKDSHDIAQVVSVLVLLIIVCGTSLLLGVPAHFLSRRYTQDRDAYLDTLSEEIDLLASRASSTDGPTEAEYLRLRSLLELRSHVVQHAIAPPSVEMVKRMPLAVLVPLATTIAAWLAVFIDGKG
jgi:hypothetical protein